MMSAVVGRLHGVKSSKTMTFNSSVGFLGNGASYVTRSNQQQHHNNDNEHDNDRVCWQDVVSVVEGGFGGVGNGGVHGLGVDNGGCISRVLGRSDIQPRRTY